MIIICTALSYWGGSIRAKFVFGAKLRDDEFKIEKGVTKIKVNRVNGNNDLEIEVSRTFEMVAQKKGRYLFSRLLETDGRWTHHQVKFEDKTIPLNIAENSRKLEAIKPLSLKPDSRLAVTLTSVEVIRRRRGFYLLYIGGDNGEAKFSLEIDPNSKLKPENTEVYALCEKKDKLDIQIGKLVDIHSTDSKSGMYYLIEWNNDEN